MTDPQSFFGLLHDMWDALGFALLAAIIIGLALANVVMAAEWIMKKKNKAVKDEIQNDNSKQSK